jgi:hypothetical protein
MDHRQPFLSSDETNYRVRFAFAGKLQKITFDLGDSSLSLTVRRAVMEELANKRDR